MKIIFILLLIMFASCGEMKHTVSGKTEFVVTVDEKICDGIIDADKRMQCIMKIVDTTRFYAYSQYLKELKNNNCNKD